MRSLLYRAFDQFAYAWNATWETGRRPLYPSRHESAVPVVRRSEAAAFLRFTSTGTRNVRDMPGRGIGASADAGEGD
jgi:hypothetical protein